MVPLLLLPLVFFGLGRVPSPENVWVCDLEAELSGEYRDIGLITAIFGFDVKTSEVNWREKPLVTVRPPDWAAIRPWNILPVTVEFRVELIGLDNSLYLQRTYKLDVPAFTVTQSFYHKLVFEAVGEGQYKVKVWSEVEYFGGSHFWERNVEVKM